MHHLKSHQKKSNTAGTEIKLKTLNSLHLSPSSNPNKAIPILNPRQRGSLYHSSTKALIPFHLSSPNPFKIKPVL